MSPQLVAKATPFTDDLLAHFGLWNGHVVRIAPDTIEGDNVTLTATLWMPRPEYEDLLERHRPKTALEELAELQRLGDMRVDQLTDQQRAWLDEHPLGPGSLHGKKPRAVTELVAVWLQERESRG